MGNMIYFNVLRFHKNIRIYEIKNNIILPDPAHQFYP